MLSYINWSDIYLTIIMSNLEIHMSKMVLSFAFTNIKYCINEHIVRRMYWVRVFVKMQGINMPISCYSMNCDNCKTCKVYNWRTSNMWSMYFISIYS